MLAVSAGVQIKNPEKRTHPNCRCVQLSNVAPERVPGPQTLELVWLLLQYDATCQRPERWKLEQ